MSCLVALADREARISFALALRIQTPDVLLEWDAWDAATAVYVKHREAKEIEAMNKANGAPVKRISEM